MINQAEQARPKILRPFRGMVEAFARRGRKAQSEGVLNNPQPALAQIDNLSRYDPALIEGITLD